MQICFVCLGNICRSPTAEGVMTAKLAAAGLADVVGVDSAGTGGWHRGEPADERAARVAASHGVPLTSRARQVHVGDFAFFDLLIAMDEANELDLLALAPDADGAAKVHLLRPFDPATGRAAATEAGGLDVPDPYDGGPSGFADVYDIIDAACTGLLAHVRQTLAAGAASIPVDRPTSRRGPP